MYDITTLEEFTDQINELDRKVNAAKQLHNVLYDPDGSKPLYYMRATITAEPFDPYDIMACDHPLPSLDIKSVSGEDTDAIADILARAISYWSEKSEDLKKTYSKRMQTLTGKPKKTAGKSTTETKKKATTKTTAKRSTRATATRTRRS